MGSRRQGSAATPDLVAALQHDLPAMVEALTERVETQVPVYREWRALGHGGLGEAIQSVFEEFLDFVTRGVLPSSSRVFEIAADRAAQGLPLEALQQAWRLVTSGFWEWLAGHYPAAFGAHGDGPHVWGQFLEFSDRHLDMTLDSFREAQSLARTASALESRALVDDVVRGRPPEDTERALRTLGLTAREVAVLLCRSVSPGDAASAEAVTEYGALLKALRVHTRSAVPWTIRGGQLLAILPAPEGSTDFVEHLLPARGQLRLAISRSVPVRSNLAAVSRQVEVALQVAGSTRTVVEINRLHLSEIAAMRAPLFAIDLPPWLRQFLTDDRQHNGDWEATARALSDNGANVAATARQLVVHPNTVYYRLAAIQQACGVDLRRPRVLADVMLACASRDFGKFELPFDGGEGP